MDYEIAEQKLAIPDPCEAGCEMNISQPLRAHQNLYLSRRAAQNNPVQMQGARSAKGVGKNKSSRPKRVDGAAKFEAD